MTRIMSIMVFVACVLLTIQSSGANIMYMNNSSVLPGDTVILSVSISNDEPFIAFQFKIPIPTAFSYISGSALLNNQRKADHILNASLLSGNVLSIFTFSMTNSTFSGSFGEVVTFKLIAGTTTGIFELAFQNPIIGNIYSINIINQVVPGFITITDVITDINNELIKDEDIRIFTSPTFVEFIFGNLIKPVDFAELKITDFFGRSILTNSNATISGRSVQFRVNDIIMRSGIFIFRVHVRFTDKSQWMHQGKTMHHVN